MQKEKTMRNTTIFMVLLLISSCGIKKEKASQEADPIKHEFLQKGEEIAKLTQGELLKNVSQAMKTGGPVYAVDFCNLRAMELKDSLSDLYNCEIRRIAKKYRNPADMPQTESEKAQLDQYQLAFDQGDTLKPEVYITDEYIEYYKPIVLGNGACLLCHGTPGEQISDETMEMINERYPEDLATGFALNDFRGAWKITFKKE